MEKKKEKSTQILKNFPGASSIFSRKIKTKKHSNKTLFNHLNHLMCIKNRVFNSLNKKKTIFNLKIPKKHLKKPIMGLN